MLTVGPYAVYINVSTNLSQSPRKQTARALTQPLDVCTFVDKLRIRFVQERNFSRLLPDAIQNDGVGVILRNGIINEVNAIIGGLSDFLRDVGVVVLRKASSQ